MNGRHRRIVVTAVFCAVAVGLAAATLDSTVSSPADSGSSAVVTSSSDGSSARPTGSAHVPCMSWLATPQATLGVGLVLVVSALLIYRQFSRSAMGVFTVGVVFPITAFYLLFTDCSSGSIPDVVIRRIGDLPGGEAAGEALGDGDPGLSVMVLAAILIAGLLVAASLLYVSVADRHESSASDANNEDTIDASGAASAAGSAAERIEQGEDVESEIYCAWRDMTECLDIANPAMSTPGEFAEVAIESGLHPAAVRELTSLFEQVRYGEFEATEARETRARDVFRQIERHGTPPEKHGSMNDTSANTGENGEYDG